MQPYIIGIIGASLLVLAWLVNIYRTFRQKAHSINPQFTGIYIIASSLLTYYSILIGDYVFATLNGIATLLAIIEFGVYWYFR